MIVPEEDVAVEGIVNAVIIALEESFRLVIAQWNVPVARRLGTLN